MNKILIGALFAIAAQATVHAQPQYEGFLCCNMRTDSSGWVSDSNYREAGKRTIAVGTPLKITGYGRQRVVTEAPDQKLWLGNDYSRDLDLGAFAERLVVKNDPRPKIATFPLKVQEAIKSMRVSKGMTREQVLMSIGYPISGENPSLDATGWRYWLDSFKPFTVHWDAQGRVRDVETDSGTRLMVVLE